MIYAPAALEALRAAARCAAPRVEAAASRFRARREIVARCCRSSAPPTAPRRLLPDTMPTVQSFLAASHSFTGASNMSSPSRRPPPPALPARRRPSAMLPFPLSCVKTGRREAWKERGEWQPTRAQPRLYAIPPACYAKRKRQEDAHHLQRVPPHENIPPRHHAAAARAAYAAPDGTLRISAARRRHAIRLAAFTRRPAERISRRRRRSIRSHAGAAPAPHHML